MSHFTPLTLVFLFCSLNQVFGEVYHIVLNSSDLCTESCLTLSQFAINSSYHLGSNTTLILAPETHHLNTNLTLSNLYNFSMDTENILATAQIECTSTSNILLYHIQYALIKNIEFIGCEGNQVEGVEEFVLQNTKFEGRGYSGSALQLTKTSAQIFNTTFVLNLGIILCVLQPGFIPYCVYYGGAIFANHSKVSLSQSRFEGNSAPFGVGGAIFAGNSIIRSSNCMFSSNVAYSGGSLAIFNSTLIIESSNFDGNRGFGYESRGGVLLSGSSNVLIKTSRFGKNFATYGGVLDFFGSNVSIETSKFDNNFATEIGGVLCSLNSDITIQASEFSNNSATVEGGILQSDSSSTIMIEECGFENNFVAQRGGVLFSSIMSSAIKVDNSNFTSNSPIGAGVPTTTHYAISEVYYITTDSADNNCTAPCLTLSQFADDFSYHSNR